MVISAASLRSHHSLQVRHIIVVFGIKRVLATRVEVVDFGLKPPVDLGVADHRVEQVAEHCRSCVGTGNDSLIDRSGTHNHN